ncbi:MAG TPA: hypothetical protein VFT18_04060 [Gaiellaceae bacterium]|nr:hypothetical protein [Gaiellaceae bacterium]
MEQVTARAAFVAASDFGEGLSTTIPRSDIQAVLAAEEEPIELVLDITRYSDGEPAGMQSVAITWERSDLERLLNDAQGDQIELTFDLDTLRRATDPSEVEAHGLRETALILAVAATAAAGGAQAAGAEPGPMLGQTAPITQSAAPAGPEIPYLSQGQGVTPADLGIATGTSPDDRAVARTDEAAAPTAAGPEIPYLSQGQGVTPADLGIATGTSPDDRAVPRTDPVATTGGTASDPGTFSIPAPETMAVVGAIALAITGAFFLVGAGRRRVHPA